MMLVCWPCVPMSSAGWAVACCSRGWPCICGVTLDSPTHLVVRGPYRYVRNPIYLAGVPIFLGIYLLYSRWHIADPGAAAAPHRGSGSLQPWMDDLLIRDCGLSLRKPHGASPTFS